MCKYTGFSMELKKEACLQSWYSKTANLICHLMKENCQESMLLAIILHLSFLCSFGLSINMCKTTDLA